MFIVPPVPQGHVYAMAKQYPDALSEYFQAYRFWPGEPLLLLCIAVTYAGWAAAGRPDDRNRAVLLAFAFLQVQCLATSLPPCRCLVVCPAAAWDVLGAAC